MTRKWKERNKIILALGIEKIMPPEFTKLIQEA